MHAAMGARPVARAHAGRPTRRCCWRAAAPGDVERGDARCWPTRSSSPTRWGWSCWPSARGGWCRRAASSRPGGELVRRRAYRHRSHGPRHPPSSSAPPAPPRRRAGWASAPAAASGTRSPRRRARRRRGARRPRRQARRGGQAACGSPTSRRRSYARLKTGIGELDRILGGGLVPGSLVLIGGSPGHRQVDADVDGARATSRAPGGGRCTSPARSRRRRSGCAPSGCPARRCRCPVLAETDLDTVLATMEAERPEVCVIDSVQTLHAADLTGAAGSVGPGARGRRPDHAAGQGARDRGAARRPRDQGGRAGRPARARAPRRLRAAVRGRARAHLPDAAGAEEPLRLDQRRRRLRDAPRRAGRGRRTRPRASSARPRARPAASCWRRWRARGRCWSRSRRSSRRPSSCRRGGWSTGSTATGSRSCWPCSPATRESARARADVFVNVAGGVRVDEPGADLAVALAVASAVRGVTMGERDAAGVLRRGRADRRAALGRRTRPAAGRGGEVRPRTGARARRRRRPTLRAAVRAALGAPASRVAA